MKTFNLLFALLLTSLFSARASIIYSATQNVPIPLNPEGVYLRFDTGTAATTFPADWDTAPWINPFFGGVYIGTSPLLRPVLSGADQILNVEFGAPIESTSVFAIGENGSSTHVGNAPGQFLINVPGYVGLAFRAELGGLDSYGWVEIQINNLGDGKIIRWAYEDTPGTPILVGDTGVLPEPGIPTLFGAAGVLLGFRRRRRKH